MSHPQDGVRTEEVKVGRKYDPATIKAVVRFVRMSPSLTALFHEDYDSDAPATTTH